MSEYIDDGMARRNALVLAVSQSIGGALPPIAITLGGLAGSYLLGPDKSLATLPVTGFVLGTAFGTIPAAYLMRHVGRRNGFVTGAMIALVGALVAMSAIIQESFWLFFAGHIAIGFAAAFVQQYRFAAADTASSALKPKMISWVMLGGVGAAIVGPQTAILTKDLLSPIPFAGAYAGGAGLALMAGFVLLALRTPPHTEAEVTSSGRSLRQIVTQPRFIIAVLCAISSYAIMSFVMTAAPLAMIACNHTQAQAALGIQWHVLAMFVPSFFTGNLIARFGKERVVVAGLGLLVACAIVGLSGVELANFWIALVLLGVGWNFGFIGATAMVADTYEHSERATVQGVNDFLVFGFVAFASFMSGNLLNDYGWDTLLVVVFPMAALAFAALAWGRLALPRG
ncbi:MAG: MFS transporter [Rhodobiaceae bacterium]|nr:MFS transporter [Rhodobiaceae bacterium]